MQEYLRGYVRELLREADISDTSEMCFTPGSTHTMMMCKLGGDKYFIKFSNDDPWGGAETDPSLQNLVEYLAYKIYGLYAGIKIPRAELVYDAGKKRVGIATSPAAGKQALVARTPFQLLGKKMSKGVYVDVFLANWDVVGTGSGNVFISDDEEEVTRLDPGGSLTFRAQGGRKGAAFSKKAGELQTMLGGQSGAGQVFQHADLNEAAETFLSVPWSSIAAVIEKTRAEVLDELKKRPELARLQEEWNTDVDIILSTLEPRHMEVTAHAEKILDSGW